jgi:4,5-DOPA dioxygenase extradiol
MIDPLHAPPGRMPAVFFGHGNPMNVLQENRYTETWRRIGASIPKPRAILAISAHWQTEGTAVTAAARPRTIRDFAGFPRELFEIDYPAPGDPALAEQIRMLLGPQGVRLDTEWGLDHGVWSVLVKAFPDADVPVLQLSMDLAKSPQQHFLAGRKLAALRDEGILLVGSGNVVHNLRQMIWTPGAAPHAWADRYNARVRDCLTGSDVEQLTGFAEWADAALAVPTDEHFLPLLYVTGSRQDDEAVSIAVDGVDGGSISMLTAVVGHIPGF